MARSPDSHYTVEEVGAIVADALDILSVCDVPTERREAAFAFALNALSLKSVQPPIPVAATLIDRHPKH